MQKVLCLSLFGFVVSCGGTDFVRQQREAMPLAAGDGWLEGSDPSPLRGGPAAGPAGKRQGATFRNTYYDFPHEGAGKKDAKVFDAGCQVLAEVTTAFHDSVCMQGSGRLAGGETISFAKRDCVCAATCPRSGQKICFDKLDPKQFPTGRGSLGKPVTPLRTVAVDSDVIPLGTSLYILEYDGLTMPNGKAHDGCFVAEDRGSRVKGHHLDVFTGDPQTTKSWNQLVPSNQGVHVEVDSPRCRGAQTPTTEIRVTGGSARDPASEPRPERNSDRKEKGRDGKRK